MNITAVALTLLAVLHSVMSVGLRVKAPLGGNVSVRCQYSTGSEKRTKYFSKGRPEERVEIINSWSRTQTVSDRYSLEDDKENTVFTVTIRNLSVEDAGQYWCGVKNIWRDQLTEVNLDVVQNNPPSSPKPDVQNASVSLTTSSLLTSSFKKTHPSVAHNKETNLTDESMYLGGSLAAIVLLCGILIAIFIRNKRKIRQEAASTRSGNNTESNMDNLIYEEIFPASTNDRPVSALHDSPEPRRICLIHQPETVVYSFIRQPKTTPDDATLFPSAESASLHYASINTVQSSHIGQGSPALSEKSHDIYATIQK